MDPVSCVTDTNGRGVSAETSDSRLRYDSSAGIHSSSELKSATTHFLPNDPHFINKIMNTDPKFVSVLNRLLSSDLQKAHFPTFGDLIRPKCPGVHLLSRSFNEETMTCAELLR